METLEERRLLSTPHVLPAGPRESRTDYMTSTMDGGFPTAPEHFEWEYTSPKLVYPFDQAVAGVSNQTHSLMTLFNEVLLRHDPYALSTSIDVSAGYTQRTTITSTDGGQSWSASLPDGYFWPAVDILLTTNGSAPNFYLTLTTVNGMAKYALTWDGYTQYTNLGRVEYTGDGNSYYFSNLGSDGYYNTPDESAQGTPIPLSNPTFNAAGDTATFQLPTDLPIGNYEAILSSPGITDMGGSNHLDGDATTTELDDLHEDFVYPFFIMPGDANHDRTINIDDYGRIDSHYPATNGYINGDFNYDNIIDSSDYFIINHNFGTVLPPMPTEPNTLTVFASRDAQDVAQMTLNWVPPTDVPDIDGFGVWCSTDGGVTFNFLQFVNGGSASSSTHTGLLDGTKYTYRIRAHSPTGGYSTTSNKAWAVTNLPPPTNPVVTHVTATTATLQWDDTTTNETGFEIVVLDEQHAYHETYFQSPAHDGTGQQSFTITGLSPNSTYDILVRAKTDAQVSAWSPDVEGTTLSLNPPSNLVAIDISDTEIDLSWADTSTGESGFRIEASLDGANFSEVATIEANRTNYPFLDALPNATYYFQVEAVSGESSSNPSPIASALTIPRAPEGPSVSEVSSSEIDVAWDGISNLSNYFLERSVNGGVWSPLTTLGPTETAYSDTGLSEGTQYEYRLQASNAAGMSDYSSIEGTYTLSAAPSNLSATAVAGLDSGFDERVDLQWANNSANYNGVIVEKSMDSGATWGQAGSVGGGVSSFTVFDIAANANYSFRVLARNASGDSDPSDTQSLTTPSEDASDYGVLETINIPTDGSVANSTTTLMSGVEYKVRASGTAYIGVPTDGMADAEYGNFTDPQNNGSAQYGSVDYGIAINDTTNGSSKTPSWGAYNSDHVYIADFTGQGAPIGLNFHDDFYSDNSGQLTVEILAPKVSITASKPQAAEGGSESGRFTVERTGDASQALTVYYMVSTGTGQATPGTDYTALSGSVTIAANARTATIDVSALMDEDSSEGTEPVTLTLDDTNKPYKADANAKTATVNILNKTKYLLAYYGAGDINGFGNVWLNQIATDAAVNDGYTKILSPENGEKQSFGTFFPDLDIDGNKRISKAESESAEVRGLGYSLGGLQIINSTRKFIGVGKRFNGFKLEAQIDVEKVVTIDPVARYPFVKVVNGPVKTNVKQYVNYYERKGGDSVLHEVDPNTGNLTGFSVELGSFFSRQFFGSVMQSDAPNTQTQVEVTWANVKVEHEETPGDQQLWRLYGNDVNHDTMPWWTYDKAIAELS
jgi:hypothetical protein